MKNAEKNRDPEKARARAMSDARCAWRKMDAEQRAAFLGWASCEPGWPWKPRLEATQGLRDALAALVACYDSGSLLMDHADRRATRDDIERARALLEYRNDRGTA